MDAEQAVERLTDDEIMGSAILVLRNFQIGYDEDDDQLVVNKIIEGLCARVNRILQEQLDAGLIDSPGEEGWDALKYAPLVFMLYDDATVETAVNDLDDARAMMEVLLRRFPQLKAGTDDG